MRDLFSILILIALSASESYAQPCSPEALMKIPGKWKKGMQGSIHNVTADNLAKEKAVLAEIHKMTSGYQPFGLDVHYSTVFGLSLNDGKKWFADPYYYSAYLLDYLCDHRDNDIKKMWVNAETSTVAEVQVNTIAMYGDGTGIILHPATYPDDRHAPFERIDAWPQQKDGYWYWPFLDSTNERNTEKRYVYLITYDRQLPFMPFTKKEYLEYQIPRMKEFLAVQAKHASELDPNNYDEKSYRELKAAGEERLNEFRKKIQETQQLLVTMGARELSETAIVKNDGSGDFHGFFKEGDPFASILIKPNPAYYKQLPKWVPQFFCIDLKYTTTDPVFRQAIPAFEKTLDFAWFRKMLGSTAVIPYQPKGGALPEPASSRGNAAPAATQPSAPGIIMTGGTKKTNTPDYDIYRNRPTKGFKATPASQLRNASVKPAVNLKHKQVAMAVKLTETSKSAYVKKIFSDIDARIPAARKKVAAMVLDSAAGDMQALANSGVFLYLGGYQQEGLWCLAQAAATKPADDNILNNLTGILVNMGAAPRALPLARYLASKYPRNTTVMNNLGQAWYALDELMRAKQVFDTVMLYAVYHPEANATRAAIAEQEGKQAEAAGFINKSLKGAYNPGTDDYARKKGMKVDYANWLYKKRPFPGEYINPLDFRPPPQCTNVNFAAELEAEWDAWEEQENKASQKINAYIEASSANYARMTEKFTPGMKNPGIPFGAFYFRAAETYKAFLQDFGNLQEEAVAYAGNQYQREENSIDSAVDAAFEKLMKKYPGGEGSGIDQEAYCRDRNAIYNTYLERMAALNDDFNARFSEPLRQLNIELMYWSQFLPEPMELREMKYYQHALFAVAPLQMRSKFEYPCEKPEKRTKTKDPFDIPEPFCPFSFKFKVTVVKLTGDCSKFEMEFNIPGGVLAGFERDFMNRKTTLALGVGIDVEVEGFAEKGDPVGFIEDAIPQLIDGSGAGAGAKVQGFIEFGPSGEMSDIGIRSEGSVEGAWTEKGDVKINGKLGVNSGVQITGSEAAQPIVDYLNGNISN